LQRLQISVSISIISHYHYILWILSQTFLNSENIKCASPDQSDKTYTASTGLQLPTSLNLYRLITPYNCAIVTHNILVASTFWHHYLSLYSQSTSFMHTPSCIICLFVCSLCCSITQFVYRFRLCIPVWSHFFLSNNCRNFYVFQTFILQ
jgi:hypothetical protein